ncbi:hypothetical protein MNV49_003056 [Pseudohyphozyma bogoriensis]|nr:hypothetical protein MNV49_003056 [Pseudohyphozyma bogoriensis]
MRKSRLNEGRIRHLLLRYMSTTHSSPNESVTSPPAPPARHSPPQHEQRQLQREQETEWTRRQFQQNYSSTTASATKTEQPCKERIASPSIRRRSSSSVPLAQAGDSSASYDSDVDVDVHTTPQSNDEPLRWTADMRRRLDTMVTYYRKSHLRTEWDEVANFVFRTTEASESEIEALDRPEVSFEAVARALGNTRTVDACRQHVRILCERGWQLNKDLPMWDKNLISSPANDSYSIRNNPTSTSPASDPQSSITPRTDSTTQSGNFSNFLSKSPTTPTHIQPRPSPPLAQSSRPHRQDEGVHSFPPQKRFASTAKDQRPQKKRTATPLTGPALRDKGEYASLATELRLLKSAASRDMGKIQRIEEQRKVLWSMIELEKRMEKGELDVPSEAR